MNSLLNALACWTGRPRWYVVQFIYRSYKICAHCGAEAGTRRHPQAQA